MPGDPLETLQEGHAAFNRDDTSWTTLHATEDVEWGTRGLFPGMDDVYHGREGVTEWMRIVRAEWEEFRVSLVEIIGRREDALAVVERIWGRGRESGAEGEMTFHTVYRFTPEAKIAVRAVYESREGALEAL